MNVLTVPISSGSQEYLTITVTEKSGQDISESPLVVSLSSDPVLPGSWMQPERVNADDAVITVRVLLSAGRFRLGTYYVYTRVTVDPEIIVRRTETQVSLV